MKGRGYKKKPFHWGIRGGRGGQKGEPVAHGDNGGEGGWPEPGELKNFIIGSGKFKRRPQTDKFARNPKRKSFRLRGVLNRGGKSTREMSTVHLWYYLLQNRLGGELR